MNLFGTGRPEPVLNALVLGLLALIAIITLLVFFVPVDGNTVLILTPIIGLGATVFSFYVRRKVTPLAEPEDEDGTPLVRAGGVR